MAKSILLVKTSSLGDVIHALPALSDLRAALPDARIDWLVEDALVAIPRLHAAVTEVIPVSLRRWRRGFWRGSVRAEIAAFLARLRARSYDAVIDAQGLLKSAVLTRAAHGVRYGLDFHSAREPLGLFYDQTFRVSWDIHAVERNRELLAQALGYRQAATCNYGISAQPRSFDWLPRAPYAVLLHATSGDYKLWPEAHWIALAAAFNAGGSRCVLTWGNERERTRSERLAAAIPDSIIAPRLDYASLAGLFAGAQTTVGVDTGLTHLSAALGVPTVGIYCGTDPAATGIHGSARACNVGGIGVMPAVEDVRAALAGLNVGGFAAGGA
jgi:heptosyltransferase-1